MFGVKESEGVKWVQRVEGIQNTSKCVKSKMNADKLECTKGIFLRHNDLLRMPSHFSYIRFFSSCFRKEMTAKWHLFYFGLIAL